MHESSSYSELSQALGIFIWDMEGGRGGPQGAGSALFLIWVLITQGIQLVNTDQAVNLYVHFS